jgi:hypothetical protein
MFSAGISGSCSRTIGTYAALVTTQKFDIGHSGANLSTVIWIIVFPAPSTSTNCLGYSGVLIGQNLLPTPPAIITTWFCIIICIKGVGQNPFFHEGYD